MKIYNVQEKLPADGQWVLAHFPDQPWHANNTPNNEHKWAVVQFIRGITKQERDALPERHPRKCIIRPQDEDGNNEVAYYWNSFGPGSFFGQEATIWCELPEVFPRG